MSDVEQRERRGEGGADSVCLYVRAFDHSGRGACSCTSLLLPGVVEMWRVA